ncbi:hypothetical protein C8R47DRAFT_598056 [Mycena vitilis]|nr:hypothetical protein C8R47DRAFT_598056 [Mycena vitilis]
MQYGSNLKEAGLPNEQQEQTVTEPTPSFPTTTNMPSKRLPQELIDAIVLDLEDDKSCLSSCSKTAKTFRVPCQRRIFRQMVLHDKKTGYSNTHQRARDLLVASPHLEVYIHNLTAFWPSGQAGMRSLGSVLRALHNVQCLTISNSEELNADWRDIAPDLDSAIFDTISLHSLDRLHLIGLDRVPHSLILHATCSVRLLSLDIYTRPVAVQTSVEPCPSPPQLEHLILRDSRTAFHMRRFMLSLNRAGYMQNTRRLVLPLALRDSDSQELFDFLPPGLYHLEIECGSFVSIIAIPTLKFLRVLELGFYIGQSRVLPGSLDLIISQLHKLTPALEELSLTIEIMPRIPEIPWPHGQPWPAFDVGFAQRGDLSRLRKVTCYLRLKMDYFHGDSDVSFVGFVTAMEGKLLGLTSTDMLSFARKKAIDPERGY